MIMTDNLAQSINADNLQMEVKQTSCPRLRRIFCCSRTNVSRTKSLDSFEPKSDEPFEYVVEKLVIKRVPIKQISDDGDRLELSSKAVQQQKSIKFSNYCQVVRPQDLDLEEARKDAQINVNHEVELHTTNYSEGILPEDMTSGRQQQRKECGSRCWAADQLQQKVLNPNRKLTVFHTNSTLPERNKNVLKHFTARENNASELDPSVRSAIEILGKQTKFSPNRRLINRDLSTGKLKSLKGTMDESEMLNLDEILEHTHENSLCESSSDNSCNDKGDCTKEATSVRWKIIIKHRDKVALQNAKKGDETATEGPSDTDY